MYFRNLVKILFIHKILKQQEMKIFVLLNIFLIFHHSCESANVFLERLDYLLNFCIKHEENVTPGVLLGVSIAKGQLENIPHGKKDGFVVSLIKKCSYLEKRIEVYKKFPTKFNEIGENLFIKFKLSFIIILLQCPKQL